MFQNKRIRKRQLVFLLFALLWMGIIFSFSARDGDTSSVDSYKAGQLAGKLFVPGYQTWDEARQQAFAEKVDHPIRKTAHAAEYAILGGLLLGTIYEKGKGRSRNLLLPWVLTAAFAASDEFHQLFVEGRSGQISDVLLDSCGAAAGILLAAGIGRMFGRNRHIDKTNK